MAAKQTVIVVSKKIRSVLKVRESQEEVLGKE